MISAPDAEERARQLLTLTRRLTELLAAEAAAFEAHRPFEAARNAEETARLANIYRHESQRINANPTLVSAASRPTRDALVKATRAFEAVLARHGRALSAAKIVTEGLVQAIAAEVAATRAARSPYGANAKTPRVDATAITLNRRA